MLNPEQKERYSRNIKLHGFGEFGQEKLLASKVLIAGAGGLGSPAIFYLTAVGVGELTIIDPDVVISSNLQRQIIHSTADIQRLKVISAKEKVKALNPDVHVTALAERLDESNIRRLVNTHDFIVDCTDNPATKFLINDVCVEQKKPFSHAGVVSMTGQIMTYIPGHACLRCAFEEPRAGTALTANDIGVLGAVAGTLGSLQAAEAVKYLAGCAELLIDSFLFLDVAHATWKKAKVKRDRYCLACGEKANRIR
ncbi:MAG: HesA/MoeB/ThiF family protein [Chloroflexi bacterium]|nr:HesA/MoeB/ThiF family protein [Chloroflexota bacterium]